MDSGDRPRLAQEIADGLDKCAVFRSEFRIGHSCDSAVRLLKMHVKVHTDADDKTRYITGLCRDVTERQRTTAALTTLMDNLPGNIYFKDRDSRFMAVNRAML